jgi:glycosyltransferase involved in cell wall biosynthesis
VKIGIISASLNGQFTGIANVTYNLIANLVKINSENEYYLINWKHTTAFNDMKQIVIRNPLPRFYRTYTWFLYMALNSKRIDHLDIVHNPAQVPTFFKIRQKNIITVHDITPYLFPETHARGRPLIYKLFFPRTLRNADRIIADSNSTKTDLIKHLVVPNEKITVIHPGVDHEKYKPLADSEKHSIRGVYGLISPFILYIGSLEPRKNLVSLLKAFHKVAGKIGEYKLVIGGKKAWKYQEIFDTIAMLGLQDRVVFTGYIPQQDLPKMYNAADLLVFPSIYEGFGLPPLEAMACGIPVITSNTSSLPEVVGDAAVMINPLDVDALADAMYQVLTDQELKEKMIRKGIERAELFTWEKTAQETLKVYREVYNDVR